MTQKHSLSKIASISAVIVAALLLSACTTTTNITSSANDIRSARVGGALDRAARDAEASGNTQQSISILRQMHARDLGDLGVAVRYAKALREDDQLSIAAQVLEPYAAQSDPDPDVLTELAMIELANGNYSYGEELSRKAITLEERNGRAFLALGTALDAQGHHQQAEVAFRRGLDYWNGDPAPILNNLALNLASQGYLEESVSILEKAKEASPRRMEIERNLRIIRTLLETSPVPADEVTKKETPNKTPLRPQIKPSPPQSMVKQQETLKKLAPLKTLAEPVEIKPENVEPLENVEKEQSQAEKLNPADIKPAARGLNQ